MNYSLSLDTGRLTTVLEEEFSRFLADIDATPIPQIQDLRALSIAWLCTLNPYGVESDFTERLEESLWNFQRSEKYEYELWHRLLPLEVAMYSITEDERWLENARANINHHSSSLRAMAVESLAVVISNVRSLDEKLIERVQFNLASRHMFCDWTAIMLLTGIGPASDKLALLDKWLALYNLNPHEKLTLSTVRERGWIENTYFLPKFSRVHRHMLWLLAARGLNPHPSVQSEEAARAKALIWWVKMDEHPLLGGEVKIEDREPPEQD